MQTHLLKFFKNGMSFSIVFILCNYFLALVTAPHFTHSGTHHCVPPNVCTEILKCSSLTDNYSFKSIIFLHMKTTFCGFKRHMPKVCCNASSDTTTDSSRSWSDELTDHKNFGMLPINRCGEISSRFRITSGSTTSPGEFPWMALIAYKTGNPKIEDFRCAGTLITDLYILTAAHCVFNSTLLGVRLGEHNTMTEIDCDSLDQNCESPVQDLLINKTTMHPLYDTSTYVNDIALIKLAKPANYSYGNVKPICLPFGDLLHVSLEGQELTVTGWGATEAGEKSTVLRKVSVPVLSTNDCRRLYKDLKPIFDKQICAGAEGGRDSCAGDSGGPLKRVDKIRRNESPRYVQYGIVSFGPSRCGIDGRPGIYTSVSKYMGWILDNLE